MDFILVALLSAVAGGVLVTLFLRPRQAALAERLRGREDESLFELRDAILALPPKSRDVLLLRYLVGCSEEETAAALGIRLGTLKSRTSRAREALAELLR